MIIYDPPSGRLPHPSGLGATTVFVSSILFSLRFRFAHKHAVHVESPVNFHKEVSAGAVKCIRFVDASTEMNFTGSTQELPTAKLLQIRQDGEISRGHASPSLR